MAHMHAPHGTGSIMQVHFHVYENALHCPHDTVASCRCTLVWMAMRSTIKSRCLCSLHAIDALRVFWDPGIPGEGKQPCPRPPCLPQARAKNEATFRVEDQGGWQPAHVPIDSTQPLNSYLNTDLPVSVIAGELSVNPVCYNVHHYR